MQYSSSCINLHYFQLGGLTLNHVKVTNKYFYYISLSLRLRRIIIICNVNSNIVASVVDTPDSFQESIFVMIKDSKQKINC